MGPRNSRSSKCSLDLLGKFEKEKKSQSNKIKISSPFRTFPTPSWRYIMLWHTTQTIAMLDLSTSTSHMNWKLWLHQIYSVATRTILVFGIRIIWPLLFLHFNWASPHVTEALWMPPVWSWARKISAVDYDLTYLKAPMLPQLLASLPLG